MKIYVKTSILSLTGKMTFTDENEKPLYYSKNNIFMGGATIRTPEGQKILRLTKGWFSGAYKIKDMRTKKLVGKCRPKIFTLKTGSLKVDLAGQKLAVQGQFLLAFQFTIVNPEGETLVTANKKLMAWGDAYEIDVHKPDVVHPEYIAALCVLFNAERKAKGAML